MAIARGAGTEILRSHCLEACNSTQRTLIFGVQHHIYTVLSVIAHAVAVNAANDFIKCTITGYDTVETTTAQEIVIFQVDMQVTETYVWNDKFSFNGHEPVDFAAAYTGATKQDAIADQGSAVAQKLMCQAEHGSDGFDILCSYIDQNNA